MTYNITPDNNHYNGTVFKIENKSANILDFAVKPEYQSRGIGSRLIDFIFNQFETKYVTAETDDDAIGFYKKYGFELLKTETKFETKRYTLVCNRKEK